MSDDEKRVGVLEVGVMGSGIAEAIAGEDVCCDGVAEPLANGREIVDILPTGERPFAAISATVVAHWSLNLNLLTSTLLHVRGEA